MRNLKHPLCIAGINCVYNWRSSRAITRTSECCIQTFRLCVRTPGYRSGKRHVCFNGSAAISGRIGWCCEFGGWRILTRDSQPAFASGLPDSLRYTHDELQNCTEFTLNVINAAIYDTEDMGQIKRTLNDHFEAQPVNINPLKPMAGAAILGELSLKDHGDTAATATFGSIERYLEKFGLIYKSLELSEWDIEADLPHQSM